MALEPPPACIFATAVATGLPGRSRGMMKLMVPATNSTSASWSRRRPTYANVSVIVRWPSSRSRDASRPPLDRPRTATPWRPGDLRLDTEPRRLEGSRGSPGKDCSVAEAMSSAARPRGGLSIGNPTNVGGRHGGRSHDQALDIEDVRDQRGCRAVGPDRVARRECGAGPARGAPQQDVHLLALG